MPNQYEEQGTAGEEILDEEVQTEETPQVMPVIEEQLVTGAQVAKTGSVRVEKHVERRMKRLEVPLVRESVEVQRVPINRVVETVPKSRKVGQTIIVPVVEEELIVTKRLILKEELHITKTRIRENTTREVTLEREHAEVKRLDAQGRIIDMPQPADRSVLPRRLPRRRGLLE
jgi:uncharacterized protein (TIGR02271 family)